MSDKATNPIPEGMHTLTPHLVCAGAAEAIDFYRRAFNAEELFRLPGPDGKLMHAALRIGDSVMMMVDAFPDCNPGPLDLKGSPVVLHLYVPDADHLFDQAVAAGATALMPVTEMFWGDRYGQVRDPFGHRWSIATHVRDVTPEEMHQAMAQMAAARAGA